MSSRHGDPVATRANHHVGASAREVAEHASALTRLELELAALELKRKAISLGVGAALAAGAALTLLFAVGFGFAAVAAAIATTLPLWAALLIVAGGLLLLAGALGGVAVGCFRRATPPVPKNAIREAKLTTSAIRR